MNRFYIFFDNRVKIKLSNNQKSEVQIMYHISKDSNLHGVTLSPRIPHNFFTENGWEDNATKRVCFSETIDGALSALNQNLDNEILYVYEPATLENIRTKPNNEVVDFVPDAHLTKEIWVLEDVELRFVKTITVLDCQSPTFYEYEEGKKGEFWVWQWEAIIDTLIEEIENLGYDTVFCCGFDSVGDERNYYFSQRTNKDTDIRVRVVGENNEFELNVQNLPA